MKAFFWVFFGVFMHCPYSLISNCKVTRIYNGHYIKDSTEVTLQLKPNEFHVCVSQCMANSNCKALSWKKSDGQCKFHAVSLHEMYFNGEIIFNPNWDIIVLLDLDKYWTPIAKFSSSKGTFEGKFSYELWTNSSKSVNNDICVKEYEGMGCGRHYVHKEKDWLLGSDYVTKVKVSLYENGSEAAWIVFDKNPGSEDNFFQPSRILESFPWNTELLKASAEMDFQPQELNVMTRFYMIEANNEFYVRDRSPHRYWMKIHEGQTGVKNRVCEYGEINYPYILYSKGPNPTLLSKSPVSVVANWSETVGYDRYTLEWSEAESFCETHLSVPMATYHEIDMARINNDYYCCTVGWMKERVASFPMTYASSGCGNMVGMNRNFTTGPWAVYCKPDQSLVGVADTMVISVNL